MQNTVSLTLSTPEHRHIMGNVLLILTETMLRTPDLCMIKIIYVNIWK